MFERFWRLTKVLYFIITVPLVILWSWDFLFLQQIHRWNIFHWIYVNDYYIWFLYVILFLISYILWTDLIRRIISYINNWTFNWFIPYIKILKRFSILIIIIWWIISVTLVSLSQNLRNECTWNNEWFNDYWICSCNDLYLRENWSCKKDIKVYDNWEISFSYPWKLIIDNKEFEDFKFFEKENILVKKYNFDSLTWYCLDWLKNRLEWEINWTMWEWIWRIKTKNEANKIYSDKKNEYEEYINWIKSWELNAKIIKFDHFTCNATKWPISVTPIEINWIKGEVINYYFTQDADMGCLTQFNTELLLVKDLDNIYSIMFKNNFWNFFNYLKKIKWDSIEVCLSDNLSYLDAKETSEKIINFLKYWISLDWTDYESFQSNYNIINEIINSIKIK